MSASASIPTALRTAPNTICCAFPRISSSMCCASAWLDPPRGRSTAAQRANRALRPPSSRPRAPCATSPRRCLLSIGNRPGLPHLQLRDHLACTTRAGPSAALRRAVVREIDPSLAVFDKHTTVVDQFRELTYACHLRGARFYLDVVVVNRTGWGSPAHQPPPGGGGGGGGAPRVVPPQWRRHLPQPGRLGHHLRREKKPGRARATHRASALWEEFTHLPC